ncbi:MAG: hypothetical protein ACXWAT_06745 [Methylobacter sp.]
MNEIVKSIPALFFKREPIRAPERIDIAAIVIKKTSQQFEQAFSQVTGYGQEQKPSNNQQ